MSVLVSPFIRVFYLWRISNQTGNELFSISFCVFWFCLLQITEGVPYAKKDYILEKHLDIDVPNLQVIKLMQSFKSKEYVRETFAWMHYNWYLTNNGIEFLNFLASETPLTLNLRKTRKEGLTPVCLLPIDSRLWLWDRFLYCWEWEPYQLQKGRACLVIYLICPFIRIGRRVGQLIYPRDKQLSR